MNKIKTSGNLSSKGINLLSHMKMKVGNGLNTLFWVDSWLTDIPLKQLYPRMFALDCNKNSTVAEKINASSISCSFRRLPRESLEEEQFSKIIEDVNSVILSVFNDRWIWSLDSSGEFLIKSTRLFIDDHLLLAVGAPTRWVSEVPIKINIMAWKVSLDKLPTRLNLSLWGIEIPSITCPICSCAESHARIFFSLVLWPRTLLPNWLNGGSLIARIYSHTMIGLNGFTLFVSLKVLRIYWKGSFTLCGG
ncbi:RNA-directed DNA polymerase, eukaryota [Tanacetum coccineum]